MTTVTYVGNSARVTMATGDGRQAVTFELNKPVELDMVDPLHRHIFEKCRTNPFFETGTDDIEVVEETPAPAPALEPDERAELLAKFEAAGVSVDKRWGMDRLRQEAGAAGLG